MIQVEEEVTIFFDFRIMVYELLVQKYELMSGRVREWEGEYTLAKEEVKDASKKWKKGR